ncbi:MAG: ABC transporter permease [Porcipelethomonas sp.]
MFSLYKKELQSYYCSPFAYVIASLFLLVFSLEFFNGISDMAGTMYKFSFPNIFYNNFFYFIFLIPALTMRTFADERKTGTEVLLMTSPLSVFQIVIAKFLAISTVFLMMLVLTLFFPVITLATGEVVWSSLICGYIGFFLWGIVCIAVGMLMSSFTDSPIIAAILGEGAMIILIFVDNFKDSALFTNLPGAAKVIGWFSTQERFVSFSQGIINLSDLVFFITAAVLFLGWNIISIEKRRWSRG